MPGQLARIRQYNSNIFLVFRCGIILVLFKNGPRESNCGALVNAVCANTPVSPDAYVLNRLSEYDHDSGRCCKVLRYENWDVWFIDGG